MRNFKAFTILLVSLITMTGYKSAKAYPIENSIEERDVRNLTEQTIKCSSVDFEVYSDSCGHYYIEFWMLPARHQDNSYSRYSVSVNDRRVGNITPKVGNWQGIGVDGTVPIELQKGVNKISVSAPFPETPIVESFRLSATIPDHLFSSEEYDRYLLDAKQSGNSSPTTSLYHSFNEISTDSSTTDTVFENVSLEYTFYKIQLFNENQDIFIATSSPVDHNIDMVYIGECTSSSMLNTDLSVFVPSINDIGGIISPGVRHKLYYSYIPASSAEMQGLNWRGPSEYSLNSTAHLATIHMTVPKTGYYVIRVRTKEIGGLGVVDVNINGDYFYDEVPISYSKVPYSIPADGRTYACAVKSNPLIDDPLLFVESYVGGRVVGFNDDCRENERKEFGLEEYDSYLAQAYKVKTSGISVASYSSNLPKSTCSIVVRQLSSSNKMPRKNLSGHNEHTSDGYIGGYPFIDLGLPSGTLWAVHNLGADDFIDSGNYFAWGETTPKKEYSWTTYKYFDRENWDPEFGSWVTTIEIGSNIRSTQYDAATTLWGAEWGLPTEEQFRELRKYCWHQWTEENGICGVRIYGPNEHSLFFPAAGMMEMEDQSPVPYANLCGIYWSATETVMSGMPESCNQSAYTLLFDSGTFGVDNTQQKCSGISIRPVTLKPTVSAVEAYTEPVISVRCFGMEVTVEGCAYGDKIEIYDLSGQQIVSDRANGAVFSHILPARGIFIVSVLRGDSCKKIMKFIL